MWRGWGVFVFVRAGVGMGVIAGSLQAIHWGEGEGGNLFP